MSKLIKVDPKIYDQLDKLRVGRQTFSDVIEDLLKGRLAIFEAINIIDGKLKYREWQLDQLDAMTKARLERADLESRRL